MYFVRFRDGYEMVADGQFSFVGGFEAAIDDITDFWRII